MGESISYSFIKDGNTFHKKIPVTLFSQRDFMLLFAAYVLNGLAFFLTGLLVYLMKPNSSSALSLFCLGSAVGVFTVTACDLYSPYWFFRLHVLGEAFLPATIFHLALAFPQEKKWSETSRLLVISAYLLSLSVGIVYELWLFSQEGYVGVHNLCMFYFGIALLFFIISIFLNYYKSGSAITKYKIRTVMLGAVLTLLPPAIIVTYSALKLGEIAVNYISFTTFIFPLSIGYAIVKRNLLEADGMVLTAKKGSP